MTVRELVNQLKSCDSGGFPVARILYTTSSPTRRGFNDTICAGFKQDLLQS